MNVKDAIEQAGHLIGKPIELEGEFIILQDRDQYITYIFSPDEPHEEDKPHQILIAYSLAELKTIIRPLPSMQLIRQGQLTDAPYFWRFPIEMTVQLALDADNQPVITKIFLVRFNVPHTTKFLNLVLPDSHYIYRAEIDYDYEPEELQKHHARAIVKSQRIIRFVESESEAITLDPDDNHYARNLLKQRLKIPGWLRHLEGKDSAKHFLLRTFALRSSMWAFGPLKNLTSIWWRPSPLYKIIRANMPIKRIEEANLPVMITGKIDYLKSDDAPIFPGGTEPKLVFTEIDEIIINETNFLL